MINAISPHKLLKKTAERSCQLNISDVNKTRFIIAKHIYILKNPHPPTTNRLDPNPGVSHTVSDPWRGEPKPSLNRRESDTMFFMLEHNLKCIWEVCHHRNHFAEMSRRSEMQGGREAFNKRMKVLNTTAFESQPLNFKDISQMLIR